MSPVWNSVCSLPTVNRVHLTSQTGSALSHDFKELLSLISHFSSSTQHPVNRNIQTLISFIAFSDTLSASQLAPYSLYSLWALVKSSDYQCNRVLFGIHVLSPSIHQYVEKLFILCSGGWGEHLKYKQYNFTCLCVHFYLLPIHMKNTTKLKLETSTNPFGVEAIGLKPSQ